MSCDKKQTPVFLSNENLLAKGLSSPLEHTADKYLPIGTKKKFFVMSAEMRIFAAQLGSLKSITI
jgi:hypothetical protein